MMNTILDRKHSVVMRISILLLMCIATFTILTPNVAAQVCEADCGFDLAQPLHMSGAETALCFNQCNLISDMPLWTTCVSHCVGGDSPDPISDIDIPSTSPVLSDQAAACLGQCRLIGDMAPWTSCMNNCTGTDSPDPISNISVPNTTVVPTDDTNLCLNQCNLISDMPLWTTCVSSCVGSDTPDSM